MRKLLTAGILLFFIAASSAMAAGTSEKGTGQALSGKITFATHRTDLFETTLKDLVQAFTTANPGTSVELMGMKSWDQVKVWMAANELPDIVPVLNDMSNADLPTYFLPLDDLGFFKPNTIMFYNHGVGPDGKFYRATQIVTYPGVVYNKKAFAEAGVDAIPKTIDDLYADSAKLKAKGIVPFASLFKDKWPLGAWFEQYALASSLDVHYWDKKVNAKELVTPEVRTGVSFLRTMKDRGYLESDIMSTNWDALQADLAVGKTAMVYLGSWLPGQLLVKGAQAEDIGMFPFPGTGTVVVGDVYQAVARNTKNPTLAKAFYKFQFEDSRFAKASAAASPMKTGKEQDPWALQMLAFGTPIEAEAWYGADFGGMLKKAEIDSTTMMQDLIVAKDVEQAISQYNSKWAAAH